MKAHFNLFYETNIILIAKPVKDMTGPKGHSGGFRSPGMRGWQCTGQYTDDKNWGDNGVSGKCYLLEVTEVNRDVRHDEMNESSQSFRGV